MLERYFAHPGTVNRIRSSWICPLIERCLTLAQEHGYTVRHLAQRVPILLQFGRFAQAHGAQSYAELPAYLEPFSAAWITRPDRALKAPRPRRAREVQGALERVLRISLPGFVGTSRCFSREPFADRALGFLTYLREERGLQETTPCLYGNHLRQFDAYLKHIGLQDICPIPGRGERVPDGSKLRP
jgi:integrase/recombinase XerD